jgi:hypothetical protein
VVVASAEARPWWLAAAPQRAEITAGDDAIAISPERQPTESERLSAAISAIWLGGHALALVAPEPPREEDEEWLPPSEASEEN